MLKARRKQLITASLLLGGLLIAWKAFPTLNQTRSPRRIKDQIVSAFTKAGYSISSAEYWTVIAMLETNFLQSRFYKEGNNLWGMTLPQIRPTTAKGGFGMHEGKQMAKYSSTKGAIDDILLYQDYFGYPKNFNSLRKLVAYMKRKGYMSERGYTYYFKAKSVQAKLNELLAQHGITT